MADSSRCGLGAELGVDLSERRLAGEEDEHRHVGGVGESGELIPERRVDGGGGGGGGGNEGEGEGRG